MHPRQQQQPNCQPRSVNSVVVGPSVTPVSPVAAEATEATGSRRRIEALVLVVGRESRRRRGNALGIHSRLLRTDGRCSICVKFVDELIIADS
jgi:hypothetical protein